MTHFEVTERQLDEYGKVFPEYDKWAWQTGGVTWVPLLVGPNRVKRFALSNLKEVRAPFDSGMMYDQPQPAPARHQVQAVEMGITFTCEPPLVIAEQLKQRVDNVLALAEVLNGRDPERQASRDLYADKLYWEIECEVLAA